MSILDVDKLFGGLIDIGKELIVDKDKQIEFAFRIAEMHAQLTERMLTATTIPWVDAMIKILYALKEVAIPLFRPVFSAAASIYAGLHPEQMLWLHKELGTTGDMIVASMAGAFPAWMASRHVDKGRKKD